MKMIDRTKNPINTRVNTVNPQHKVEIQEHKDSGYQNYINWINDINEDLGSCDPLKPLYRLGGLGE